MPTLHTRIAWVGKVLLFLCEWDIEKKKSLTIDNTLDNDVCVVILKSQSKLRNTLMCDRDFFHNWCCVHIINLIVKKWVKEIEQEIEKVCKSVNYAKWSQMRKRKFLKY